MTEFDDDIVIDLDEEVADLPAGLYACEVKNVEYKNSKKEIPFIVVSLEIDEGPYTGLTLQDWISQDKNQSMNLLKLNLKRRNGFIKACLNGEEPEGTLRPVRNDKGVLVFEELVGCRVGAYLVTRGDNINVDRGGYVEVSMVDNDDEEPFS